MPKQSTDTSAHWRAALADLAERKTAAEADLAKAKKTAADAAMTGDGLAEAKHVQHHRDRLEAMQEATTEAERRLAAALEAEAEAAAQIERGKADEAMKARDVAAEKIDKALADLGAAHSAFEAAGSQAAQHFKAAGAVVPQRLLHGSPDALSGALMTAAPTFHAALRIPRAEPANRRALAGPARQMAGIMEAAE